jgi:hypothetical protein
MEGMRLETLTIQIHIAATERIPDALEPEDRFPARASKNVMVTAENSAPGRNVAPLSHFAWLAWF